MSAQPRWQTQPCKDSGESNRGEGNGGCLQGAAAFCTNAAPLSLCMYVQQEFHVHKLTPSPWQATSGL